MVLLGRLFPKTIGFARGWTRTNQVNFVKIGSKLRPLSRVLIHKYTFSNLQSGTSKTKNVTTPNSHPSEVENVRIVVISFRNIAKKVVDARFSSVSALVFEFSNTHLETSVLKARTRSTKNGPPISKIGHGGTWSGPGAPARPRFYFPSHVAVAFFVYSVISRRDGRGGMVRNTHYSGKVVAKAVENADSNRRKLPTQVLNMSKIFISRE